MKYIPQVKTKPENKIYVNLTNSLQSSRNLVEPGESINLILTRNLQGLC